MVDAELFAEVDAEGVSEEGRVDNFEILFGDFVWVITVLGVVALFEGIIDGVDGRFSLLVSTHGFDVGFLDGKENEK